MTSTDRELLQALREQVERLLRGEEAVPVAEDPAQDPDILALVRKMNRFVTEFNDAREFAFALAAGNLDVAPPPRNLIASAFKQLHAALQHLTWQTCRIAEGDYSQRVHFMGGFSTAFNSMVEALRENKEALTTARLSAERAKAAAEEANRAKDHFLAILSHELRAPLTPVLAAVSMLLAESGLDADTREALEVIRRNAELEARLIDDLLDLNRIARGKMQLDLQPVRFCEVIHRAIEICRPDLEARRIDFSAETAGAADCAVRADSARLQQVFWNLLKNAIKFTPPGGRVRIRCRMEPPAPPRSRGSFVVVEISDSGIGIDRRALGRIFHAFEQADLSIARQSGGLGLGLSISKAMVEMHGGTIEAHSEGTGKGATFQVRLPVAGLQPPDETERKTSRKAGDPQPKIPPLRILLVDDHADTVKVLTRLLARQGHQVQPARDMATALQLTSQHSFDLLISDLGLPDGSGLELIRALRARNFHRPAIALSGYGQEEDVRRSREAGFTTHLIKPVLVEQLYESIAAVVP